MNPHTEISKLIAFYGEEITLQRLCLKTIAVGTYGPLSKPLLDELYDFVPIPEQPSDWCGGEDGGTGWRDYYLTETTLGQLLVSDEVFATKEMVELAEEMPEDARESEENPRSDWFQNYQQEQYEKDHPPEQYEYENDSPSAPLIEDVDPEPTLTDIHWRDELDNLIKTRSKLEQARVHYFIHRHYKGEGLPLEKQISACKNFDTFLEVALRYPLDHNDPTIKARLDEEFNAWLDSPEILGEGEEWGRKIEEYEQSLEDSENQQELDEEITLPETYEESLKMKKEAEQFRKDNNLPPLEDIPWDDDDHSNLTLKEIEERYLQYESMSEIRQKVFDAEDKIIKEKPLSKRLAGLYSSDKEKNILDGLQEVSERLADLGNYESKYEPLLQGVVNMIKREREPVSQSIIIYYNQLHLVCKPFEVEAQCPYLVFNGTPDDAEQFGQNMLEYGEWSSYLIPQFCKEPVILIS